MKISIICALSENRVIGKGDRIPWHIREDLLRFKNLTLHHTVIMGRATFESVAQYYKRSGRPIPDRKHIIVTRDADYRVTLPNCYVVSSIEDALKKAKEIEAASVKTVASQEVFISGGEQIFKQTIRYVDRLYLTIVRGNFDGDKFFPDYSAFTRVVEKEEKESEGYKYSFVILEKE